jgi:hypothetical protein
MTAALDACMHASMRPGLQAPVVDSGDIAVVATRLQMYMHAVSTLPQGRPVAVRDRRVMLSFVRLTAGLRA